MVRAFEVFWQVSRVYAQPASERANEHRASMVSGSTNEEEAAFAPMLGSARFSYNVFGPDLNGMEPARTTVSWLSILRQAFSDLFFPPVCGLCGRPVMDAETALCESCMNDVRIIPEPLCRQCGRPVVGLDSAGAGFCGNCLTHPPAYEKARYATEYTGELRKALIGFKFSARLQAGKPLGALLVQGFSRFFEARGFDLIVPIPLHRRRLAARGYNQSVILAERLSRSIGVPVGRTCFRKVRDTPPQTSLSRAERLTNLRGSFQVARPEEIEGRSVLIVDDVATTGSTIAEAARTIRRAGASRVGALVLALRPLLSEREDEAPLSIPHQSQFPGNGTHRHEEFSPAPHRTQTCDR